MCLSHLVRQARKIPQKSNVLCMCLDRQIPQELCAVHVSRQTKSTGALCCTRVHAILQQTNPHELCALAPA